MVIKKSTMHKMALWYAVHEMKFFLIAIYATGLLESIYALPGYQKDGYGDNEWEHNVKKEHHPPATTEVIHYQVAEPTTQVDTTSTSTTYTEILASYSVTPSTEPYYQTSTYERTSYTFLDTIVGTNTFTQTWVDWQYSYIPGPLTILTFTSYVTTPTTKTITEPDSTTTRTITHYLMTNTDVTRTSTTSTQTLRQVEAYTTETDVMVDVTETTLAGAFTETHTNLNTTETVYVVPADKEAKPKKKWKHKVHYGRKKDRNDKRIKDDSEDDWGGKKKNDDDSVILEKVYISLAEPTPLTETVVLATTESKVEPRTSVLTTTRTTNTPYYSWTTTTEPSVTSYTYTIITVWITDTQYIPTPVYDYRTVTQTVPTTIATATEHIEETTASATSTSTVVWQTRLFNVTDHTTHMETQVTDCTQTLMVADVTKTELVSDSTQTLDVPFETVFVRKEKKAKDNKKWKKGLHYGKKKGWGKKGRKTYDGDNWGAKKNGWEDRSGHDGDEW